MPDITPRIFISYSRKDGETFAADLRTKLANEFSEELLWRDREGMEGGRDWWQQIVEALDHVEYMVLAATPEAMKSPIVKKEWRMARQKGVCVCPVQVPSLPVDFNSLPQWMRDVHFYNLDMEWNTFISFLTAPCRATKVPFMAPDLPDTFVNRPGPFEELKTRLLDSDRQNPVAVTTALQGAGGFGKTTLAAALSHDEDIQTAFDDGVLWVTLGEKPDLVNALAKLYRALADDEPNFRDEEEGAIRLSEKLADLDCLVVIDDIWNIAHLRPFMRGGKRCSRLFTTRDIGIATGVKASMTEVDEMTADESIELLGKELVGADHGQLAKLAQRLGEYAQLLEIANGMMRTRMATSGDSVSGVVAWLTKLLDRKGVLSIHRDDEEARKRDIGGVLSGSLELLTQQQRERLYELSIFKDDEIIPLSAVMRLWELDDFDTEEDIVKIASLALLKYSTSTSGLRLHDVVREYLLTHIPDQPALHARLINAWGDFYNLPDVYAWRYYAYHLNGGNKLDILRTLLLDFRWLQTKLNATDATALMADCDYLSSDDTVRLLQGAIRLSLNTLTADKLQLGPQLIGRLFAHQENEGINSLLTAIVHPVGSYKVLSSEHPSHFQAGGALIRTLTGHKDTVNGAIELADGRVLSWSKDNTLRLWQPDGTGVQVFEGHKGAVNGILTIKDGFASWGDDGDLRLWKLDGATVCILDDHTSSIDGVLSDNNGHLISWSADHTLRLWEVNGKLISILDGHTKSVSGLLIFDDGMLLSWSEDCTLRLWEANGTPVRVFEGHTKPISGALIVDNERFLSWSADHELRLWTISGAFSQVLKGHRTDVTGALMLSDSRLLSWSDDGIMRMWKLDGTFIFPLLGHTEAVTGALKLKSGRILSWSMDASLRLWADDGTFVRTRIRHMGGVLGVQKLRDDWLLSWSDDHTLQLWELNGTPVRSLEGHTNSVLGSLELRDGRLLSWSADNTLRLWESPRTVVGAMLQHEDAVAGILKLKDGNLVIWSTNGRLELWDQNGKILSKVQTGIFRTAGVVEMPKGCLTVWSQDQRHRFRIYEGTIVEPRERARGGFTTVLQLRDGGLLTWSEDTYLRVYERSETRTHNSGLTLWGSQGNRISDLAEHISNVNGALELKNGRILSWSEDRTLQLWEPDGSFVSLFTGHNEAVIGAIELKNGRILSWSIDNSLRLWNEKGVTIGVFNGHTRQIVGALETENREILSWSQDGTLRLWNLDGSLIEILRGHTGWISGALRLADGRFLSWSDDRTLRLWAADGTFVGILEKHTDSINGVITMDTKYILSWSTDGLIQQWDNDGNPVVAFYGDAPITICTVLNDGETIVAGDNQGRVMFLQPIQ